MIKLLSSLFGLFQSLVRLFADRQLVERGKAEQRHVDTEELNERVEKAEAVVDSRDPARDERLRSRFDRSFRGE